MCGLEEVMCPYQARALISKTGVIIGVIPLSYLPAWVVKVNEIMTVKNFEVLGRKVLLIREAES